MRSLALLVALMCCTGPTGCLSGPTAQPIVDDVLSRHPQITALALHAIPAGESTPRVVAANNPSLIGSASGTDLMQALTDGETSMLRGTDALDVTAPIFDADGEPIAAATITLRAQASATMPELLAEALAARDEISLAVQESDARLW